LLVQRNETKKGHFPAGIFASLHFAKPISKLGHPPKADEYHPSFLDLFFGEDSL